MENNEKQDVKKRLDEMGIEEVVIAEVKKFGTSAHIPISKRYIGKKVTIFIKKNK